MEIVKIDLVPSGVMPSCHASQYDIGREIRFLLTDGGEEYTLAGTETISIELRKPDGTSETIAIENTSSNYVDWVTSDGELDLSGVYLAEISIKNGDDVLGSANFIVKTEADAYDGAGVRTVTVGPADICTFETNLPEPLQSVIVDVVASGGNGTPDNPNPINGYSSANITRCGVNLCFDAYGDKASAGTYLYPSGDNLPLIVNNTVRTTYAYVGKNADVVISFADVPQRGVAYGLEGYPELGTICHALTVTALTTKSFKVNSGNYEYIAFYYCNDLGNIPSNCQIELGSTATAFTPYNGQTYAIAFGQTVYGGVFDVTRGKLKPCIEYPSYNGETLSGRWLSSEATYVEGTTPPTGSQVVSLDDYGTDIDLTPEVISAIVGTNNVFADCGETTVKYLKAGV